MPNRTVRRVGKSLAITLPKSIVETDEGVVLTPSHPRFAAWARAYKRTKKRFRHTLKALAK